MDGLQRTPPDGASSLDPTWGERRPWGMYRFEIHAPLTATVIAAPAEDDRTGPPLSQGFLFTMVSTVASAHLGPDALRLLARIDPDAWYHGQLLETLLAQLEEKDPNLPAQLGRNIYFMWRSQLEALGFRSASAVLEAIPSLWTTATRGDCGEMRAVVGPRRAHLEMEQPYNCMFEAGTVRGLLEAYDATNVRIAHTPCMRDGAPFCVLECRWDERETRAGAGTPR